MSLITFPTRVVAAALPALFEQAFGDLVDMGRLGAVGHIKPAIPHVVLAEPPHQLARALKHADGQIAVAKQ